MRERFNKGNYRERLARGEFKCVVIHQGAPELDVAAKEPVGTVSQLVSYRDSSDNEIARVHQYLRPDGTLAGSGLPDPKRLFENGIFYRIIKKKNQPPDSMP